MHLACVVRPALRSSGRRVSSLSLVFSLLRFRHHFYLSSAQAVHTNKTIIDIISFIWKNLASSAIPVLSRGKARRVFSHFCSRSWFRVTGRRSASHRTLVFGANRSRVGTDIVLAVALWGHLRNSLSRPRKTRPTFIAQQAAWKNISMFRHPMLSCWTAGRVLFAFSLAGFFLVWRQGRAVLQAGRFSRNSQLAIAGGTGGTNL